MKKLLSIGVAFLMVFVLSCPAFAVAPPATFHYVRIYCNVNGKPSDRYVEATTGSAHQRNIDLSDEFWDYYQSINANGFLVYVSMYIGGANSYEIYSNGSRKQIGNFPTNTINKEFQISVGNLVGLEPLSWKVRLYDKGGNYYTDMNGYIYR